MAGVILFFFVSGVSLLRTECFQFIVRRSSTVQHVGGIVDCRLSIAVSEDTPAYLKLKAPFENNAAVFDITNLEVINMDRNLMADSNTTALMKSSAGNEEIDIAVIDFGNITHASPPGVLNLVDIEFKYRVLDHALATCGSIHWVSIGVEYLNRSVFAAQLSTTIVCLLSPRPALNVLVNVVGHDKVNIASGTQVGYDVTIKHGGSSSAKAQNGTFEWRMPNFLTFATHTVEKGAVTYTQSGNVIYFKFGALSFSQKIKFRITANVGSSPLIKKGKTIDFTAIGKLQYNAEAGLPCSSSSGSRTFTLRQPVTVHHKFYKIVDECDADLGMESGGIEDAKIKASSYAIDGSPAQARLNNGKGWLPSGNYRYRKNQFLQVEFAKRKRIRRIALQMGTQGILKGRTTAFKLLFSDDGTRWTGYKENSNRLKEFTGNKVLGQTHYNILRTPMEAKFARIVPTKWENGIALRAEFYGCDALSPTPTPGPVVYSSRVYLLDAATNTMYLCSIGVESKIERSSCYYTKDNGQTWTAIDRRVLSIVGYDPDTKFLYGVDRKGLTLMESEEDLNKNWKCVSVSTWTKVNAKANKVLSVDVSGLVITDDPLSTTPQTPHVITATNGQKWGASADGIYVDVSGVWKRKASWD